MIKEISALVEAAKRFDPDAIPKLRAILGDNPVVYEHFSDLAGHVETQWIALLAGDDAAVRESLVLRVDELRQDILGEGADTALEGLLTERIVTAWLMVRFFDAAIGQAVEGTRASHVRYLQQQLDKSQRRYIAAVKGLAETRKLLG